MPETPPPLVPESLLRKARDHGRLQGCLLAAAVLFAVFFVLPAIFFGLVAREVFRNVDSFREEALFGSKDDDEFSGDAAGLREVWIGDRIPDDVEPDEEEELPKVVRIPLTGVIDLSEDGFEQTGSAATALRSIRRATEDPDVDAILLLVDSGGGSVTASDILYDALRIFRLTSEQRRVVVLMGDTACSGAYYASLPADRILAHPTTITGSIGVILPAYNVRRLADRIGVSDESIQSGDNKAMLHPMRDLTDEQRTLLQETVDELHTRFCSLVTLHRNLPLARVRELADGRIYTARQAKDNGLVDDIGYLADAENAVAALLGADKGVSFYQYEARRSLRDLFSSPSFWGAALQQALPSANEPAAAPRAVAR